MFQSRSRRQQNIKKQNVSPMPFKSFKRKIQDYQKHSQSQSKVYKVKRKSRKIRKRQFWSRTEQSKYVKFLAAKQYIFNLPVQQRRKVKVNLEMSKAVKTRSTRQCHSHHQKMVIKYGSIKGILQAHKQLLEGPSDGDQNIQQFKQIKVQEKEKLIKSVQDRAETSKNQNRKQQRFFLPSSTIKTDKNHRQSVQLKKQEKSLPILTFTKKVKEFQVYNEVKILKQQLDSQQFYIHYFPGQGNTLKRQFE